MANESTQWLYSQLKNKGYNVGKTVEEFDSLMVNNNKSREWAYNTAKKSGLNVGTYDEFSSLVGTPAASPSTAAQEQQEPIPTQPRNNPDGTINLSNEEIATEAGETPLSDADKRRMMIQTQQMSNAVGNQAADFNERVDNLSQVGLQVGQTSAPVKGKKEYDPVTGQFVDTFITPLGNKYNNEELAELEISQLRQATDMSVGGQLRKAYKELEELKQKQGNSAERVHEDAVADLEKNKAPLALLLFADTYPARQMSDKENRALAVAIRQKEEQIKNLEEQRDRNNGVDVGFWRGFGRIAGDFRTWDFGASDALDAMTLLNADDLKGENATEGERRAYDDMMRSIAQAEQTEQQYGGNASFWNRAGIMTGHMPSFMIDFFVTGGGYGGLALLGKQSTKAATKIIGKEVVDEIAAQGVKSYIKANGAKGLGQVAANWTIKALGTTADDLLIRAPLMTNTVQIGKTASDIVDRKLGAVVIDENGNYDFSNDKTWGQAIWQGEANSIIENYSEMFGAHLDPVITFGNMSKLANVVGAKRLGAVLSKADAGALNGIMGTTQQVFNQMGVSDYLGEVTEEYYGQLWRTMLNLDDAYMPSVDANGTPIYKRDEAGNIILDENGQPIQERTNLFATKQFHGDIWGGMALSMGLMGVGKHTITAAQYASMKHGVNKADAAAKALLGTDTWESLREKIDLTTNENIGTFAETIVNDSEMTNAEKAAILTYMERSLSMRGFNLGTIAQSRNQVQDEFVQTLNESYLDGYSATSPIEMQDAKNQYEYHRQQISEWVTDDFLADIDTDPIGSVESVLTDEDWTDEERQQVLDYINARHLYNGMIQRVRDDIDGRIEESNAMIDAHTHRTTGMVQPATMKNEDRKVHIVAGNVVSYEDGTGIDLKKSDESIIIRDLDSGKLEQISPSALLSIDEAQDANEQKEIAAQAIRMQYSQEAADMIDGTLSFQAGEVYTLPNQDGTTATFTAVANEQGLVDNGDGTINIADEAGNITAIAKDFLQEQANIANMSRVVQFEEQRAANNAQATVEQQPLFAQDDLVTLRDENGNEVRGNITLNADQEGKYEVYTEQPINGQRVNMFTADEINNMLVSHIPAQQPTVETPVEVVEPITTEVVAQPAEEQEPTSILASVPTDEKGNPLFTQVEPNIAYDALLEAAEGNEEDALLSANAMVQDLTAALKKAEKAKIKGGATALEKIQAAKEHRAVVDAIRNELTAWQSIAAVPAERQKAILQEQQAAEAEARRIRKEQAAQRAAEQAAAKAAAEEAARIEREALNGVPDFVDDTPQDARARGYRRVSGHKVDRQEPLQALTGKEIEVKFADGILPQGKVAVIEAEQLQPSHIQGQRNAIHFIDEAQPKERKDDVSVISAQKIAGNIRPEEITSSITAYTGAPTTNTRGEVIQGNSRSDALRLMWATQPEQAAIYKEYLKEHAADFGLTAEQIDAMNAPVLVNMLNVADEDAITLGQYVAQDTESGGIERIKPKNAIQQMGNDMRHFAGILLRSSDEEMSFSELLDTNGTNTLRWMSEKGYISPTQYSSAFDVKGNLTPEAKNDLRAIMYQAIFQGASTQMEEMFNTLPAKAQRAILATAYRDYESAHDDRMIEEIQNSIRAFYALSQDKAFAAATNLAEARRAVESWKRQYQLDDVTGESFLPQENFSNFALQLATMYKGCTQTYLQDTFNSLYDIIQGTQQATLFGEVDNTPRTLSEAINQTLNIEYNGQKRSDVVADNTPTSEQGESGSTGDAPSGEHRESGEQPADNTGGAESVRRQQSVTQQEIETAEADTETNPTEKQKEAGNYKKGHIQVGKFKISIENPKGSIRSGVDANGDKWEVEMHNTYGYILGTEGVDGDHIDVFLADNIDAWDGTHVFIIDQYNPDGTFDEHKVMLGFNDSEDAEAAFLSNYDEEWAASHRLEGNVAPIEEFEKWIASSHRKTKAFADYASVKKVETTTVEPKQRKLTEQEANNVIAQMKKQAEQSRDIPLTVENWLNEFGEDSTVSTPIGQVKMGENQLVKLAQRKRESYFGMIKPTLENPDVILEEYDPKDGAQRDTKLLFVKTFIKADGSRYVHFESVTVQKDNLEVSVSSHEVDEDNLIKKMQNDTVLHLNDTLLDSEMRLIEPQNNEGSDLVPTPSVSDDKGTTIIPNSQEISEKSATQHQNYTIEPAQYTNKRGQTKDYQLVKFTEELSPTNLRNAKAFAKGLKGWYDKEQGGFMMRSEEDAQALINAVTEESKSQLVDAAPLSLQDVQGESATPIVAQVNTESLLTALQADGTARLSDHATPIQTEENQEQSKNEGQFGLVSDARMAELQARLRQKMSGQMNMGIDPEILAIGMELAVGHLDRGIKTFADFSKQMIADLGDTIRPYLKSFYNGARELPEVIESGLAAEMTPYDEVSKFDMANFGKAHVDALATAEEIVAEQDAATQAKEAEAKLVEKRNEERKSNEEKYAIKENDAPLIKHFKKIKQQYPDALLLFRAGNFYEAYMEDAEKTAQILGITLTKSTKGFDMSGFPFHALDTYLPQLVRAGIRVAICDKLEAPTQAKSIKKEQKDEEKQPNSRKSDKKTVTSQTQSVQTDLFGGSLFDETNTSQDNEQEKVHVRTGTSTAKREGRQQPQPNESLGASAEDETLRTDGDGVDRRNPKHSGTDAERSGELSGASQGTEQLVNEPSALEKQSISGRKSAEREKNRALSESLKGVTLHLQDKYGVEHKVTGFEYYELANVFYCTDHINGPFQVTHKELESLLKAGRKETKKATETEETPSSPKNTRNNHSERGANHAPTSVDARIDANIKAIELAKELLENGQQATTEQMAVLRKFSGWGGLGKAFSETKYVQNEIAKKLRNLLGQEGYDQAVMSANSAYYTPAYVVDTLWDIAEQMGFKGGNILEGSAGIGNILGQMPTSISERSDIHAIEIDNTSGGILSLLYPDAKVDIQGFEETRIPNGSVDLAITNVPFVTGLRVNDTTGDKDLSKKFHNIHDFCIAKNVRKLREGGIGIFITSNGTLDNSQKLRDWVVSEGDADFVGAFRMHNKTFGGTGVTSDIIVIRKRVNGKKSPNAIDVSTVSGARSAEYDTGETRNVKGNRVPIVKRVAMDYNKYFIDNPDKMAGEMKFAFENGDTFRPTSKGLYPNGQDQEQMLAEFAKSFANMQAEEQASEVSRTNSYEDEQWTTDKRVGQMYVKDGKLVTASPSGYTELTVNANKVKGHTKVECFEAYEAIKTALNDVLQYQTENESDADLQPLLDALNKAYDDFVNTYGHFNKNTAIAFLRNDIDFPSVASLETYTETGDKQGNRVQHFGKSDVFSKRVVQKESEPHPTNVKDGIIASIFKYGSIDIPYIAEQLNMSQEDVTNEILSSGYGYMNPITRKIDVSYQYLSGNVREKLRQAQENNQDGEYDANIKALEGVLPLDIPAHLIEFTLGSSWIDPKMYDEFTRERTGIKVTFTAVGGTWYMDEPYSVNNEQNRAMGVISQKLGKTIFGHELIEAAMQNKTITVSETRKHWDGSTETIVDKEATQACATKIFDIREDFKEWARQKMQSDSELSAKMERQYNDMFNNYVPLSIPSEFIPEHFAGASTAFTMRPHQSQAIVRGTMQPLLLAHEVGTGKTFTLISTAMEMRRLGTARKPMVVVQNATVGQFVASAKALYPNAKILTLEEADRSAEGRQNFYAKIRYNDWDMIVVPQSTFEFIPDSEERQMAFINAKIEEKIAVIEQMKSADKKGNSMLTRQAEREVEKLRDELAELSQASSQRRTANEEKKRAVAIQNAEVRAMEMLDRRTDDVENFDDMGIDALLIDEAHEYKHLGFSTAMQRGIKGIDPSYSKKSQGVYLKTQAILEKNNGRNVIFATGTPISNTAAEIWTFMRYLMPADTMQEYGIYYFDDFVRNFGNIQQMPEFKTNGKFQEVNRFAGYVNLPELARIWSSVADIVLTQNAAGVNDKIPETIEGGSKPTDIYLPQTRALRGVMKFVKAQLEAYDKMSGKEKKENSHIPLTMYGIAKQAAVDARLVQEDAADEPNSKTNEAVRQTLKTLEETAEYKGTVAIFADNYRNKYSGFNLYDDIRDKLIAKGVPAEQIVVIRPGMTIKQKLDIFDKVNRGDIRVILGSTFTLGTGVNIQERLNTLIHLDAPNRPMDYTQRNGRMLRQGNQHKEWGIPVRLLRFGVEDSLDVTAYQRLKTKGAIADSIMHSHDMISNSMVNRVIEEEEDVFGDAVAQLSGSEYALLKNNAEKNVRKYEGRKKQWEADQMYIHHAIPRIQSLIKSAQETATEQRAYLEAVRSAFPDGKFTEITIGKQTFESLEAMAAYLKEYNSTLNAEAQKMRESNSSDRKFRNITISIGNFDFNVTTVLDKQAARTSGTGTLFYEVHREMTYSCPELGLENVPVKQMLLKNALIDITENVITGKDFSTNLEDAEQRVKHFTSELEQVKSRQGRPFEYEQELQKAREQLLEYTEAMKIELAEKEAKYAAIDAEVQEATIDEQEDDEMLRMGDGVEHTGTSSIQDDLIQHVNEVANALNLGDKVEIITSTNGLNEKQATAKGFFNKRTRKISIVVPNNLDTADIEKTILHEAVAHYGLRNLFGDKFDTFIDDVYRNASKEVRNTIVELSKKHNWDIPTATEEYLAGLAETTEKPTLWQKLKAMFKEFLRSVGLKNIMIRDNELRYILWSSYENLKNGGKRTMFDEAADVEKQYELKVGAYEDDILYRRGHITAPTLSQELYENAVVGWWNSFKEAWHDQLRSIKALQDAIAAQTGAIRDHEDVYHNAMHKSSVDKVETDRMQQYLIEPLLDIIHKIAKRKNRDGEFITQEDIEIYLNCKHALERNERFARRDAKTARDKMQKRLDAQLKNKKITPKQYAARVAKLNEYEERKYKGYETKSGEHKQGFRERDYSGLTAIFSMAGDNYTVEQLEAFAQEIIDRFESEAETDNVNQLWKCIHALNDFSLAKSYETGLIGRQQYESTRDMFEYYVPLRGFAEETAEDVYDYITHGMIPIEKVMKHAKGRTSKAADLFATMMNMAHSAISMGNKNLVKQKLFNLAMNHETDLLTVSKQWYEKDAAGEWVPAREPAIDESMSPEEKRKVLNDYEEIMQEAEKRGEAKRWKEDLQVKLRVTEQDHANEHSVTVKRAGHEYRIWINGNPKAAQAINGMLNPDSGSQGWAIDKLNALNRFRAKNLTAMDPEFMIRNFKRDLISSSVTTFAKHGAAYMASFEKNVAKALNPVTIKNAKEGKFSGIYALYSRFNRGKLDMNNETERYFYEFITNGGETGYSRVWSIDDYQDLIRDSLNSKTAKGKVKAAWAATSKAIEFLNQGIENTCRFAAFMTARQYGASILQATAEAKEVSVNFNRKGSGKMGNALARSLFMFLNPSIQGFAQHLQLFVEHPVRMIPASGAFLALGFLVPFVPFAVAALFAGDDDDEKKENDYWNLSPFTRRNNICLRVGNNKYIKIDLPHELRTWYGLGEIAYSTMMGKMDKENVTLAIISQMTQALPLDPVNANAILSPNETILGGAAKNIVRSTALGPIAEAYWWNEDFTGRNISFQNEFNKYQPEWKKASSNTAKFLVETSRILNNLTGGTNNKKGVIDFNPSAVEHVFESYLGGRLSFPMKFVKTFDALTSGDDEMKRDMRNYPFVGTTYISTESDYYQYRRISDLWKWYKTEAEQTASQMSGAVGELGAGAFKAAEEIDELIQSGEYTRQQLVEAYKEPISTFYQSAYQVQEADPEQARQYFREAAKLKEDAVKAIMEYDKPKENNNPKK